jgi:hypothetical protein
MHQNYFSNMPMASAGRNVIETFGRYLSFHTENKAHRREIGAADFGKSKARA